MIIRTANMNDVSQLASVHVLAWRAAYTGHMPDELLDELTIEKRRQDWQGWLAKPGAGTTYVIEDVGRLLGFSIFGPSRDQDMQAEDIGEILAINIHPDYWGQGYGRQLCEAIFAEAYQRNWRQLMLWMLVTNKRAHGFYLAMGFRPDGGEREDFIINGHALSEIRYQKELQLDRA